MDVFKMRADTPVVLERIFEAVVFCQGHRRAPEQVTHREKRRPGMLITGVRIGPLQQLPQLRLEMLLEILAQLAGGFLIACPEAHMPSQHLHQLPAHHLVEHGPGVGQLLPP